MTEWYPENYNPKLSADDWQFLLNEEEIFSINDLEIMKRFLEFGLDFFHSIVQKIRNVKRRLEILPLLTAKRMIFTKIILFCSAKEF